MSEIPAAILEFFVDEQGKTMEVKGTPGSGKTIFALTLLKALQGDGVYLSTRVDPDTLYRIYPWIKEVISEDNVVDATQSERAVATGTGGIKPLRYTTVPDFLKAVYIRTENMDNPVVIIDSWDAVVSYTGYYEARERGKLEHNICDFARRTKTKLIFIVEYTEQRPLDYLVDSVIVTENYTYEERCLRRMWIQKLRGSEITSPSCLFTLTGGVFNSFPFEDQKSKIVEIEKPLIPDPITDPRNTKSSTGIKHLDDVIGGYARGSLNVFEGDYLPYAMLARAVFINTLNLNRTLFILSAKQKELLNEIYPFVKEQYRDNVYLEIEDITEVETRAIVVFDLDNIEGEIGDIAAILREKECIAICYMPAEGEGRKASEIKSIASIHLKTKHISGIPCIYGVSPRTGIYALHLDTSDGYPTVKFTLIE